MNIKQLMTTSVIALVSFSAVQAAGVLVPLRGASEPIMVIPAFSWTGFYFGSQIGNFSSNVKMNDKDVGRIIDNDRALHPSGFMSGVYAGFNIDFGHSVVLGLETDAIWADRKGTVTIFSRTVDAEDAAALNTAFANAGHEFKNGSTDKFAEGDYKESIFTYEEKWSGATRVRIGFTFNERVLPYVSGGIAYAQMRGLSKITGTKVSSNDLPSSNPPSAASDIPPHSHYKPPHKLPSYNPPYCKPNDSTEEHFPTESLDRAGTPGAVISHQILDQETTMVGYTIGAGLDFAMIDNVILRAEYRYSDFGKKKFESGIELKHKINELRVGIAYKF